MVKELLAEWLDGDFLKENDVLIAVVLQSEVTVVRTRSPLRLEIEFPFRHGLAFGVVGNLYPINEHDRAGPVERNFHGVPLGAGFAGLGQRLGQRIERTSDVVLI